MTNAKQEFLTHINDKEVVAAWVEIIGQPLNCLPLGYNRQVSSEFLNKLDVEYCDSYGTQELHGTIWYADNTWSTRESYDGMEWWQHHSRPRIPDYLIQ
jgi:hypothetical protein